ncbi:MAG: SURF1 family protein [Rhizobiales bacterium]|nr:SURF1 family protein [Hyphomicrobiales bacterium]
MRHFTFRPMLVPTLMTLVMLPVLIGLGIWQLHRLDWKLDKIEMMENRLSAMPAPMPAPEVWPRLNVTGLDFRQMSATGRFDNAHEFHYFTQDDQGQAGYSILTPLLLDGGGAIIVDRGFVPQAFKDPASRPGSQVEGEVTIVGVARVPGRRGYFDGENDLAKNIWYVRDPALMGRSIGLSPVAPFLLEAEPVAGADPQALPRPGAARVQLVNSHLQYAITWFSFALILIVIYVAYHRSNGRFGLEKP